MRAGRRTFFSVVRDDSKSVSLVPNMATVPGHVSRPEDSVQCLLEGGARCRTHLKATSWHVHSLWLVAYGGAGSVRKSPVRAFDYELGALTGLPSSLLGPDSMPCLHISARCRPGAAVSRADPEKSRERVRPRRPYRHLGVLAFSR